MRGKVYSYATIPEFLTTLYSRAAQGGLYVGRGESGSIEAVLVFEARGDTVYVEAYFGPIQYVRAGIAAFLAPFRRLAYHKQNRYFEQELYGTR